MSVLHERVNASCCCTLNQSPRTLYKEPPRGPSPGLQTTNFGAAAGWKYLVSLGGSVVQLQRCWAGNRNPYSSSDPGPTSLGVYPVTFPPWASLSLSSKGGEVPHRSGCLYTLTVSPRSERGSRAWFLISSVPGPLLRVMSFTIESKGL